jgi:putative Mg2+ transporter-C (MgtC) family protein
MLEQFQWSDQDAIMIVRITLAFVLGAVVGWERQRVRRPAGLRTHMLVAGGAAAFTVASVFGFDDLGTVRDPARLAAQIITGIGFLGAGVIFQDRHQIRGLTTAASIWIVAAIGVMIGLGMIWVSIYTTIAAWFALRVLKRIEPAPSPDLVRRKGKNGNRLPDPAVSPSRGQEPDS